MKLLALDTSTDFLSGALWCDDALLAEEVHAPREHAALILPMIERLLGQAGISRQQLDAIAFGRGPGSFTGLRIAAATTQGLALALDLPVVPISGLQALAAQLWREQQQPLCLAVLDARMGEVYWGCFERVVANPVASLAASPAVTPATSQASKTVSDTEQSLLADLAEFRLVTEEQVSAPAEVGLPDQRQWHLTGNGSDLCVPVLQQAQAAFELSANAAARVPLAKDIAMLARLSVQRGDMVAAADALPVYLRNNVALTEAERAAASKSGISGNSP